MLRSRSSLASALALSALVFSGVSFADQILEIYSTSLTTYVPSGKTLVQGARPRPDQRGVNLDGSLRAAPMIPASLAGNPFESAAPGGRMMGPVDLCVGVFAPTDVDMALPAPGFSWVISRSFNSRQDDGGHFAQNGYQGFNWFQGSQPELHFHDDGSSPANDLLYLVYGADRYVEYQRKNASSVDFKGKNGAAGAIKTVTYSGSEPDTYVLIDGIGNEFEFFDFGTDSGVAKGQLWRITDPAGNVAYVGDATTGSTAITNGFDGSGRITKAYDTADRRYSYSYSSGTIGGVKRLESVLAETRSGGTWASPTGLATVGTVEYEYYSSDGDDNGDAGDLQLVTITTPLTDSGISDVRKKHYRYWDGTFNDESNAGHPHEIRLVLDFEGARNFDWSESGEGEPALDEGYLYADLEALEPYAAAHFEYDSSRQIDAAYFNGECGCSGCALGLHTLVYHPIANTYTSGYDAVRASRTVVGRPDGSYLTQYFDEVGQTLSSVITDDAPGNTSPAPNKWVTSVHRDERGGVDQIGTPESVASYTHDSGGNPSGAITLESNAGLVWTFTRPTTGNFTGFSTARKYSTGTSGTAYYQDSLVLESKSKSLTDVTLLRPLVDKRRSFPSAQSTETAYEETDFSYTTWSGLPLTIEQATVTPPVVPTSTNGSNSATPSYRHHRKDGLVDFEKSEDDIITYSEYTNGQLTKRIQDADTGLNSSGQDFYSITIPSGFASSGTELHLKTTRTLDAQGRLDQTTLPTGRVEKEYYSKLGDGRLVSLHYPRYVSGTGTFYGPVAVRTANHAGKTVEDGIATVATAGTTSALTTHIDEGDSDFINGVALASLTHVRTNVYDKTGTRVDKSRVYFLTPTELPGTDGTHYDESSVVRDNMGRVIRSIDATGTISRTSYDAIGRAYQSWIGTNDNGLEGGSSSGTNNMVKVEELEFDGGAAGKNSLVTERTRFVEYDTDNQRVTTYTYDVRGRVLLVDNPVGPDQLTKYDNMGRTVAVGQYSSTSASSDPTSTTTNRLALRQTFYDERGRVWKAQRHKIDVSDGSDDDNLQSLSWYDDEGRLIKQDGEQLAKFQYDRLGRQVVQYVLAIDNDSTYAHALDVSGDVVLEQYQTAYDSAGRTTVQATVSRYHTSLATPTGSLDTGLATPTSFTLAGGSPDVLGRVQISASWYDAWDRLSASAQYGTNGASDFTYPGSAPSSSDDVLVTSNDYNTDGTLLKVTDPKGLVTQYEYDAEGRRTKAISNYVNGSPSSSTADDDQIVQYGYTDGLQTSITVYVDGSSNDQVTTYTYGVVKGASAGDSQMSSNRLLAKVQYPESTDSTNDVVTFAYNAQGQQVWKKDQYIASPAAGGNVIVTTYDTVGRETSRLVNTVGSGFDNAVLRIDTGYTALGQVDTVTQYSTTDTSGVVDQVKYLYDGWGNITNFRQDVDGAVGGSEYYDVEYAYEKATDGRNTIRRTSETLGGKTFTFYYEPGLSDPDLNDAASRVAQIRDGSTVRVNYDYLGVGQVVGTTYDEPDVFSRQYNSTAGQYPDLDTLNRVVGSKWTKDLANDVDFYRYALTYDRNSNITKADQADNSNPDADGVADGHVGFDIAYTMDNLNRLTVADEGTLSGGSITSRTRKQEWTLTQTGNWSRDKLDLNGDADWSDTDEWNDVKTFNKVNEIGTRDLDDTPGTTGNNYTLAYDPAGNMTDDGTDYDYEWDAFYRLRKVKTQGGALVAEYRYNGLGYRIGEHWDVNASGLPVDGSDPWYYSAYDERWRMVATYRSSDSDPKERFVHQQAGDGGYGGSSYIDLVAFREKDANTAWTSASDGTLEERLYYCQNQHADVVALITAAGGQREMDRYSAYGVPFGLPTGDCDSDGDCDTTDRNQVQTWINAPNQYDVRGDIDLDGDVDSADKTNLRDNFEGVTLGRGGLSAILVGNQCGEGGYESDPLPTGDKYHIRNRVFDAELGRWMRRDPLGYADGDSLYSFCVSMPSTYVDPRGLKCEHACTKWGLRFVECNVNMECTCDKCQLNESGEPCKFVGWGGKIAEVLGVEINSSVKDFKQEKCLNTAGATYFWGVQCTYTLEYSIELPITENVLMVVGIGAGTKAGKTIAGKVIKGSVGGAVGKASAKILDRLEVLDITVGETTINKECECLKCGKKQVGSDPSILPHFGLSAGSAASSELDMTGGN